VFSSPLQRAIEKGMEPGNSLERELYYLDRYPVHLREDGMGKRAIARKPSRNDCMPRKAEVEDVSKDLSKKFPRPSRDLPATVSW